MEFNDLLDYTAQIFISLSNQNKEPVPIGTGVFINVSNNYFLITASHVYEQNEFGRLFIFMEDGIGFLLDDDWRLLSKKNGHDNIDLAVMKIKSSNIAKIQKKFKFFEESLLTSYRNSDSIFIVCGYPHKLTKLERKFFLSEPFIVVSKELKFKKTRLMKLSPIDNIFVSYARKSQFLLYEKNKLHGIKDLQGISGGGLWIYDIQSSSTNLYILKLAGIVIEANINKSYICAVRIELVRTIIEIGFEK